MGLSESLSSVQETRAVAELSRVSTASINTERDIATQDVEDQQLDTALASLLNRFDTHALDATY